MKSKRIISLILFILIIIIIITKLINLLEERNKKKIGDVSIKEFNLALSKLQDGIIEENQNEQEEEKKIIKKEFNIELNDNNYFYDIGVSNEDFCRKLLDNYINYCLYYPQKAYELLNQEYREARFKNLEGFEEYRKDSIEMLQEIYLDKYVINSYDDYTEYIVIDQFENYYTFKCYGGLDYEIILDNYTMPTQEYLKEYANGTARQRVNLNVRKFIEMINSKDYINAYEKLADSFKQSTYASEESFKEYIKENLYEYNEVNFIDYVEQGNFYIYEVEITDKFGPAHKAKKMQIIMQLEDGIDFKMSFNIK